MGQERNEMIEKIRKFKKNIEKEYGIEKLILFGSAARTNFRKFNDIDLLVVTNRKQKQLAFLPKLYHEWHIKQNIGFPVDFICFNRKEFQKLSKQITIVKQALDEGLEV